MKIIDSHCDVLYRLQEIKRKSGRLPSFLNNRQLDVHFEGLQEAKVFVQFFALFAEPSLPDEMKWQAICEQLEIYEKVLQASDDRLIAIRSWDQIQDLQQDQIGTVLALEGIDPIGLHIERYYQLIQSGVRSVGLTWNRANAAADGVWEVKHGGLSNFGKEIIAINNEFKLVTDLSHLSEASYWEVLDEADHVYASHSNVFTICPHPRNLTDLQLQALFAKGGRVHVTFYPPFLKSTYQQRRVTREDLVEHIAYIHSLGGEDYIGFGSDFDGIDLYVEGLAHVADYQSFIQELRCHFSDEEVEKMAYRNFLSFLTRIGGR